MLRRVLIAIPLAVALLAPAGAAQASDRSLRRSVVFHEKKVTPLASRFARAVRTFSRQGRPGKLMTATRRYRTQCHRFYRAIAKHRASTHRFRSAKRAMRISLKQYDKGLGLILRALRRFKKGATVRAVSGDINAGQRALTRATRNQKRALRLFKIRTR